MIYYIGLSTIVISALAIRKLIEFSTRRREPKGMHSDKAIIGNGWGIYDGEYVEGRYDI